MVEPRTARIFRGLAICFWLLAISNFSKPLQLTEHSGFVLFGTRLTGGDSVLWSLVFGTYLVVYGLGLWHMKRIVIGMAHAYALYVLVNLSLYWINHPPPSTADVIPAVVYSLVAVSVSAGSAVLLSLHRKELVSCPT